MDHPSNLRLELRAAIERADAELERQKYYCVQLKSKLLRVVDAVERDDREEAKKLMTHALDYEYTWLLDCEIGTQLSEYLGFDEEGT